MALVEWPGGLGESDGPTIVTGGFLGILGNVWYVDSATGDDTYNGRNRLAPFATIGQAISDASAGDIIICLTDHAETLTSAQTISKTLTIIGAGQSSGLPTVKFTNNQSSGNLFTVTAAAVVFENIWFEENAAANSSARIDVSAASFEMHDCYVQCGGTDEGAALSFTNVAADGALIKDTTFVSTATSNADQPEGAINCTALVEDHRYENVTFDGGTAGFSDFYAVDYSTGANSLHMRNITCANGADLKLSDGTGNYITFTSLSGSARVEICDV